MRKMKKILAWLTVLTVNVSMMPMPTVAAATATDASTALNEETITSDATKEATQAQETAKKAVESATKAAATTAAKKVTTETKKAGSKSKSAASTQSLQDTIEEGIVKDRDQTKIDVSDYDASKAEVKKATNKVLKDNSLSKLTDVTYDTNSEGKVETVNVETDVTYLMAVDELEAINDAASDEDKASEATMEEVEKVMLNFSHTMNLSQSTLVLQYHTSHQKMQKKDQSVPYFLLLIFQEQQSELKVE